MDFVYEAFCAMYFNFNLRMDFGISVVDFNT